MPQASSALGTVAERVTAGAAFLDERIPEWTEKINIDSLDIYDYRTCVLGQMYGGSYIRGADALGLHDDDVDAEKFGFAADQADSDLLTAEWKRVITERRAAA